MKPRGDLRNHLVDPLLASLSLVGSRSLKLLPSDLSRRGSLDRRWIELFLELLLLRFQSRTLEVHVARLAQLVHERSQRGLEPLRGRMHLAELLTDLFDHRIVVGR